MPSHVPTGVWVVLGIVAACYGLMPLMIKATQSLKARPRYQALRPENVAPDVAAFLAPTEAALRANGFYASCLLRSAGDVPGVTADLMLFTHVSSGDKAMVTHVRSTLLKTPTVTIETVYADGYALITTNFADAGTFPPDPRRHRLAIPRATDVHLLCEIHRRRRVAFTSPRAAPVLPPPGGEAEYQEAEDAEECVRVAAVGYYFLGADGERYYPTFKGAYLMTWKLMWPVSSIRRFMKRRHAKRTLRELGLDPALV